MNKLALIIGVATIIFGCSKRDDYFAGINTDPSLTLFAQGGSDTVTAINDSIKLGNSYTMNYSLKDEEILSLEVIQKAGSDSIVQSSTAVLFYPKAVGTSLLELKVKDSFGKESSKTATFICFSNGSPICVASATKVVGGVSPYEVNIDASLSYDTDSRWGGKIVAYEYKIQNNYVIVNSLSSIRYIFESAGQKKITIRAQDNDGEWSEEKIIYLTL